MDAKTMPAGQTSSKKTSPTPKNTSFSISKEHLAMIDELVASRKAHYPKMFISKSQIVKEAIELLYDHEINGIPPAPPATPNKALEDIFFTPTLSQLQKASR